MPPKRPAYFAGGYYHIYNRGSRRLPIFREQDNYLFVLENLKKYLPELSLTLIAYCLLPNHYHFLVRQEQETPAGLLPQRVFNSYSKAYNKRYQHSGTLFEGPYRVKQIDEGVYLLHLCRYIHANPVKHCLVADLASWPYSNYLEWIAQRKGTLVDRRFIQDHFSSPAQYQAFVQDNLQTQNLSNEIDF